MVLAPTPLIRNAHLVAQHVPYHPGLLSGIQCLDRRHAFQPVEYLIMREGTTIATPKHFFE